MYIQDLTALDRINQARNAVEQIKEGDSAGGGVNVVNAVTGVVAGLAGNQGTRSVLSSNNFYANIGLNAGFNASKSETKSHQEKAVVTTITGKDENSSIAYNNVKNVTYEGTQAKDTSFIYNNVGTIKKEAVELNNSYSSSGSSFGINAGATVGYGHKVQTTGNGGTISASRSNYNTEETLYENGIFVNVNGT